MGGAGGRGGAGGAGGDECNGADLLNDPFNCGECGRICSSDDVEDGEERCTNGVCDTDKCKDGASNLSFPEAPDPDDGCEAKWMRVFVTTDVFSLPFDEADPAGGARAADAICEEVALEANLVGSWMAWTSDSTTSPSQDFIQSDLPYMLVNKTVIAQNWADLIDGDLDVPIGRTEDDVELGDATVWTGTRADGAAVTNGTCLDWDGPFGDGSQAALGNTGANDTTWTRSESLVACSQGAEPNSHHLYCFEQPDP